MPRGAALPWGVPGGVFNLGKAETGTKESQLVMWGRRNSWSCVCPWPPARGSHVPSWRWHLLLTASTLPPLAHREPQVQLTVHWHPDRGGLNLLFLSWLHQWPALADPCWHIWTQRFIYFTITLRKYYKELLKQKQIALGTKEEKESQFIIWPGSTSIASWTLMGTTAMPQRNRPLCLINSETFSVPECVWIFPMCGK